MTENITRFAGLLTRAINRIRADECKRRTVIRDDLGYAAGRDGRTAIDYWRRDGGHIPAEMVSFEVMPRNESCSRRLLHTGAWSSPRP